jgi:hypothetical protein
VLASVYELLTNMSRLTLFVFTFMSIVYTTAYGEGYVPRPELLDHGNEFYKLPDHDVTDFMVEMIRYGILEKPTGKYIGEITLSIGGGVRATTFNCDDFYKKIGRRNKIIVDEKMARYTFVCRDGTFNREDALKKFSAVLTETIDKDYVVDAHWGWFSMTGDKLILQRFLDNYLYKPISCHPCIKWSFGSNARANPDVMKFLLEYAQQKTPEEQEKLKQMLSGN